MQTYRIGQTKYARDRRGSGVDGRWNLRGQYVIYTAGSLALACLEKLAHSSGASLYAGDFSVTVYDIPDSPAPQEISIADLLKKNHDWHKIINYPITQTIGSQWLQSFKSAVLKVPSAIIGMEYNYLFNPAHPDFDKIKINAVTPFRFDQRLMGK